MRPRHQGPPKVPYKPHCFFSGLMSSLQWSIFSWCVNTIFNPVFTASNKTTCGSFAKRSSWDHKHGRVDNEQKVAGASECKPRVCTLYDITKGWLLTLLHFCRLCVQTLTAAELLVLSEPFAAALASSSNQTANWSQWSRRNVAVHLGEIRPIIFPYRAPRLAHMILSAASAFVGVQLTAGWLQRSHTRFPVAAAVTPGSVETLSAVNKTKQKKKKSEAFVRRVSWIVAR